MIKVAMFIWVMLFGCAELKAQGLNNLWLLGYDSIQSTQTGRTEIEFHAGTGTLSYSIFPMNLFKTHTNITNRQNNLLFYTNGIYVANRTGAIMHNGEGLNPSWFTANHANNGLNLPQAALILPHLGDTSVYYLFHSTLDEPTYTAAKFLYLSTIDVRLHGGLGAVIAKNQPIISDSLNAGMITAVKHGNGRDWWVLCHQHNTNIYYRFLLKPTGLSGPFTQQIGISRPSHTGQAAFAPNGNRFAYHNASVGLEIFDFDRCTGLLANPVHITLSENYYDGGVEFSPNSDVLYVTTDIKVFQYNLQALNIPSSQQLVAEWDGFFDPAGPPFATFFNLLKLAPDGSIYITTGNSTLFLHKINNPNNIGLSCNLTQHSVQLPTYYSNTLPNHPNYHLGALAGSPCDTLTTASADLVKQIQIQLYPNPNSGEFHLSYAPQSDQGQLQVYDVLGKLVHQEAVAQWSQVKRLSLPQLKQGVYHCRLSWGEKSGVVRFVKE